MTTRFERATVGPVLGLVAAGVSLGVASFVAGVLQVRSPVIAVGDGVIDIVPGWVKTFAIDTFGTNDKLALLTGIFVLLALFAVVVGVIARRSVVAAFVALGVFAIIGVVAGVESADPVAKSVIAAPIGAAFGALTVYQFRRVRGVVRRSAPAEPQTNKKVSFDALDRRQFIKLSGGLASAAALAGVAGRWLGQRVEATTSRLAVRLPAPLRKLAPVSAGSDLGVPGVAPFVTPNASFYRIDTALTVPQVPTQGWELKIKGMVGRQLRFSFDELLDRKLVEADVTLTCVSNEVGGNLIGNARWLGVPLRELLDEAGVDPEKATQVVGRSVDDFACGFPTAAVYDGRDALVALGMNGEPLPIEHGFPARLVVAGLYGYVSATKWLKEIDLTTLEAFDSYWVPRGWSKLGPIKTESRIDTPRRSAKLRAGKNAIAGVAWAQTRGITKVEVRINDDEWQEARLGEEVATTTWRQWVYEWDAPVGLHKITVRATDGTGEAQTEVHAPPAPDGASGWHSIPISVA